MVPCRIWGPDRHESYIPLNLRVPRNNKARLFLSLKKQFDLSKQSLLHSRGISEEAARGVCLLGQRMLAKKKKSVKL